MDKENKSKLKIKVIRNFSEEFKRAKVKELEQKQITISKLVSLYGISRTTAYKWLERYSQHYKKGTRLVVELESESKKNRKTTRTSL